jgi:hypothetical protein
MPTGLLRPDAITFGWQTEPEHGPHGQMLPHMPQFAASVVVSTHVSLQHVPLVQVPAPEHIAPLLLADEPDDEPPAPLDDDEVAWDDEDAPPAPLDEDELGCPPAPLDEDELECPPAPLDEDELECPPAPVDEDELLVGPLAPLDVELAFDDVALNPELDFDAEVPDPPVPAGFGVMVGHPKSNTETSPTANGPARCTTTLFAMINDAIRSSLLPTHRDGLVPRQARPSALVSCCSGPSRCR